jgi:hypothetical protein
MGNYLNPEQSAEKRNARMDLAAGDFEEASQQADRAGMTLKQKSEVHYQLRWGPDNDWIMNIYPSNQRLYADPNHKGPFLPLGSSGKWRLYDIVVAASDVQNKYRVH